MARGSTWYGTTPLLVGAGGLLLLAFGAKGMQDRDEAKEFAQQMADNLRKELKVAENPAMARIYLVQTEEAVNGKVHGKTVDLESLAPNRGEDIDAKAIADQAYERIYAVLSEQPPNTGIVVAERIAFYCGLVLVFLAGVLLYRRTPESAHTAW